MDTIFMNSENSKTSKLHVLILKVTDKLDLRIGEKTIALSNIKSIKTITINLKHQRQHGMIDLNYLMDRILYFKMT